jgi:hypothetical protein
MPQFAHRPNRKVVSLTRYTNEEVTVSHRGDLWVGMQERAELARSFQNSDLAIQHGMCYSSGSVLHFFF